LVECEVRDLTYSFPNSDQERRTCLATKAILTLTVVRVPLKHAFSAHSGYNVVFTEPRSTRHNDQEVTFAVTLREWDLPDFIIPTDVFLRSVNQPWHNGLRVSVPFKEYSIEEGRYNFVSYRGKVVGMANVSTAWPQSPWDAVQVCM
jgi:hypothetical protein